jgi:alkane 1-monooxygenase
MSAALWLGMVVWLGPSIVPYLALQALVGITLLEAVNYLEHYGMLRQRVGAPGKERYERVDPSHSWNSNNIATNVLLYHLQRHSDHHAQPTRRYQALRDDRRAPALPTGYAGMILLALVPTAWRRVMDARVLQHFDGDMSRANIRPGRRDALLAKYPPASRPERSAAEFGDGSYERPTVDARGARCPGCGYTYDVATGDPREGFPAGTPWAVVPDSWSCPDCGVRDKIDFVLITPTDA